MKSRMVTLAGALGVVGCSIQVLKYLPFVSVLFRHVVPCSDGTTTMVYLDYSPAILTSTVLLGAAFLCLVRIDDPRVKRMSQFGVAACMVLFVRIVPLLVFGCSATLRFYEDLLHATNLAVVLSVVGLGAFGDAIFVVALWELAEFLPGRIRCVGYASVAVLAAASGLITAASSLMCLVPCLAGQITALCQWMDVVAFSLFCVMFVQLARHGLETSAAAEGMPFSRKLLLAIVVYIPIAIFQYLAFNRFDIMFGRE